MSRTDRIKEELGWLKIVLAMLVAIDASLVAWLAPSDQRTIAFLEILGIIGVVFVTAAIVWVNRAAVRLLRALEDE